MCLHPGVCSRKSRPHCAPHSLPRLHANKPQPAGDKVQRPQNHEPSTTPCPAQGGHIPSLPLYPLSLSFTPVALELRGNPSLPFQCTPRASFRVTSQDLGIRPASTPATVDPSPSPNKSSALTPPPARAAPTTGSTLPQPAPPSKLRLLPQNSPGAPLLLRSLPTRSEVFPCPFIPSLCSHSKRVESSNSWPSDCSGQ